MWRGPVTVLRLGQLNPPSSPVCSGLAAGGSGGGWAQGPVGVGVLFPTAPSCLPGAPHSAGLRDPVRASQLIFCQWGQVACSGLLGLIPWSHTPPTSRLRLPFTPPLCPSSSPGGPVAPSLFPSPIRHVVTRVPEQRLWARAEGAGLQTEEG